MTELLSASEAKKLATTPKQSAWLEYASEKIMKEAHRGAMICLVPVTDYGPLPSDIATLQGLNYQVTFNKPFHGYEISWELG